MANVGASAATLNGLFDPLKELFLALADSDGMATRSKTLFALADTGILDDLNCADLGAEFGGGGDAPATYDDFMASVAQAMTFRVAHRNALPAPPRGFPLRQLKEMYQTACNDFDRTKAGATTRPLFSST
jgi:hypothetical protein